MFRLLGGLWPVKGGKIRKPHFRDIFYIPQRPYLPKGSLREEIIYPMSNKDFLAKGGKDEELFDLLESLEIGHIKTREPDGFSTVRDWTDVLSGGEKQRVAMCRLYYHKPKYAILDECTSAVSVEIEDKMYNLAKNRGITLITVSHKKQQLLKFHNYIVRFAEDSIVFEKVVPELAA